MSITAHSLLSLANRLERTVPVNETAETVLEAKRVGRLFLFPFETALDKPGHKKVHYDRDFSEMFDVNDLKLGCITIVKLYQFSRNATFLEIMRWAHDNRKVPIGIEHLVAIGKLYGCGRRSKADPPFLAISALGSICGQSAACLVDDAMWFSLDHDDIREVAWDCEKVLFGFVDFRGDDLSITEAS